MARSSRQALTCSPLEHLQQPRRLWWLQVDKPPSLLCWEVKEKTENTKCSSTVIHIEVPKDQSWEGAGYFILVIIRSKGQNFAAAFLPDPLKSARNSGILNSCTVSSWYIPTLMHRTPCLGTQAFSCFSLFLYFCFIYLRKQSIRERKIELVFLSTHSLHSAHNGLDQGRARARISFQVPCMVAGTQVHEMALAETGVGNLSEESNPGVIFF